MVKVFDCPIVMRIGSRLTKLRKKCGLSQGELAQMCNLKLQQIYKHEAGYTGITVSRLLDIARALEVSPEYFYEEDEGGEAVGVQRSVLLHYFGEMSIAEREQLINFASSLTRSVAA